MEPEYDAATCWTVAELRGMGIPVPESVPEEGWIRRCDLKFEMEEVAGSADGVFTVKMRAMFLAPVRWIDLTVTVGEE